jgi:hypothetical protein
MLKQVEQIINDPKANIDAATRQRMQIAIKLINDFVIFAKDPELKNMDNAVELKAARKAQIEAGLKELMLGNLYVTEANRAIFKSVLGFYSRDSYYASREFK